MENKSFGKYGKEKSAPILGEVKAKTKRTTLLMQRQKLQFIVLIISLLICSYIKIKQTEFLKCKHIY
jgi:hypothetical protein